MRDKHQIESHWADEAINDEMAIWFDPDPKSESGRSVRIIGWSPTAQMILVVLLLHGDDDHPDYWGLNAWRADGKERRIYEETETEHG